MSNDYKVPLTKILDVQPHPGADRLDILTIYGYQVIASRGTHQVGNSVIYIPIDSILPIELEEKLFPADSKIKLHHHRVRQIKIRGLASQGMIIGENYAPRGSKLEDDLSEALGIKKYEPPVKENTNLNVGGSKKQKAGNPLFDKYNGLNNIKWLPNAFKPEDDVIVQEKLHGSNARASKLPFVANTLFKKIKKFLGLTPTVETCYGSNNVDISAKSDYKGYYGEDIYAQAFKRADAFNKIQENEIIYGEIVGPGIQKNYSYGLKEIEFVLFDVKIINADGTKKWLSPYEVEIFAASRGFKLVPVLYKGKFDKDLVYKLTKGKSEFNDKSEKIREGIVIKSLDKYTSPDGGKNAVKWVSEDYLQDQNNSDFH